MPRDALNATSINCSSVADVADAQGARGASDADALVARNLINMALGPLTMALAILGGTGRISMVLSVVVALMITCFGTSLAGSGVTADILAGLIPSIPDGASELALALIGTTCIPVNLLCATSTADRPAPLTSHARCACCHVGM